MRLPTPEEEKRFFWMEEQNDKWCVPNSDTGGTDFKEGTPKDVLESYALWEAWRYPNGRKR